LAAQNSTIFSGKQSTDASSDDSETVVKRPLPKPVVEVDSERAKSPVINTGKNSGQSAVVQSSPQVEVKQKAPKEESLPWEQQSARKDTQTANANESTEKKDLPWAQQSSSNQSGTRNLPEEKTSSRTTRRDSEARIRRVIIDPVTGLYIETELSSENNSVNENINMSFEHRQEDLLEWPFWEMSGRIGLTVVKDSYNGSVNWEQNGDEIDFRFRGPLGFGGLRIHGTLDEQVRVKTSTGQDFTVSDFESEMQTRMGWSIPINSLRYWALGIVDPEVDADVVLNENDLLEELVQGDWKVVYQTYQDVDGVELPRKFRITGPDTKIKMIVNDWSIPSSE